MSLLLRSRIIVAGAIALALWLAWELATGSYLWPVVAGGLALGGSLAFLCRVPPDGLVVGLLLFGYLVGNRGFAQLMPSPHVPLLPAEAGLLIAGIWLLVRSALQRTLPVRRDLLNACVLAWLVIGTARVCFDVRPHGFVALRDYAMIYYAGFFFITQAAVSGDSWRFFRRTLLVASIAQPAAAVLVDVFPDFFLSTLVVRGVPLIYFKGDLALTFTAVSAFLLYFLVRGSHRLWAWPLATLELLHVLGSDNRASMLGVIAGLAWLAFSRARRFVWVQVGVVAIAILMLSSVALLTESRWAKGKFDAALERVVSITDLAGQGIYTTEESGMKGDNNRFRVIWWRTVIADTLDQNPLFGLGFGHDLAASFLRAYNPDMADDFTARSPHSIVINAFGRMGFVGLASLLAFIAAVGVRTWRSLRDPDVSPASLGLWASIWVILVSACFGVVLEGPMGAVVFWSLLGLVAAGGRQSTTGAPEESAADPGVALQRSETRAEVLASPTRMT